MLTPEEIKEIEREMLHYPNRESVCIDAMKIVQRHRGWISDESLGDLADFLKMSREELDGVATFYNLIFRRPVGRHVLFYCDSVSCWLMGGNRLRDDLARRLNVRPGETSKDGKFTLLPIVCLGVCDHAPAVMIDFELHRDVTPENVGDILERYD